MITFACNKNNRNFYLFILITENTKNCSFYNNFCLLFGIEKQQKKSWKIVIKHEMCLTQWKYIAVAVCEYLRWWWIAARNLNFFNPHAKKLLFNWLLLYSFVSNMYIQLWLLIRLLLMFYHMIPNFFIRYSHGYSLFFCSNPNESLFLMCIYFFAYRKRLFSHFFSIDTFIA